MIRLADYVMNRIAEAQIEHLFYVPGAQCFFLTDALRKSKSIKAISVHHEQAAAMAALSYSTINENIGALLVTTGCAGTNTLTGVLHAYQDSIPLLVISGQQNYVNTIKASGLPLRQVGIQETDIETLVKPITKYAITVDNPKDIAYHLDKALFEARTGRKGPVWIDIPLNVQNSMIDEKSLHRFEVQEKLYKTESADLEYVVSKLSDAKRPVLLIGNGIRSAGAKDLIKEVSHKYKLPVVMSRLAADIIPYDDEFNFGLIGGVAGANRYANFIVQNSDLVLSIGSRLSIEVTGPSRNDFAREAVKIVVDIDAVEHSKNGVNIDKFISTDAKEFLEKLLNCNIKQADSSWLDTCRHWHQIFDYNEIQDENKAIDMKLFMRKVSSIAPDFTCYLSDAGFTGAAAPAATFLRAGQRFVLALSQGEMGFTIPGACGAAVLSKGPVVAYTGDGSAMMNLQELQTITRNQFNIKIVIINNNGYSSIRHGQKAFFRDKLIGSDSSNGLTLPSFEKIAHAFDIRYVQINKFDEIEQKMKDVFSDNKPCLVEVFTDPDQFELHNGLAIYGKRKVGFRPIEDQSPYIDRDLFFKEMIVKPMDTSFGEPM